MRHSLRFLLSALHTRAYDKQALLLAANRLLTMRFPDFTSRWTHQISYEPKHKCRLAPSAVSCIVGICFKCMVERRELR